MGLDGMRLLRAIAVLVAVEGVAGMGWRSGLEAKGFVVQEGKYNFFDLAACKDNVHSSCYAVNPLTPYGLPMLPPAPEETDYGYVGRRCANDYSGCRNVTNAEGKPLSWNWRIRKGEAVLLQGKTPPKSEYFSFTPYLFSRFNPPGWHTRATLKDGIMSRVLACPPGFLKGNRCEIFGDVNNALNMNRIGLEDNATEVFDKQISILLTWDEWTEAQVHASLEISQKQALAMGPVHIIRFPGKDVRLGVTSGKEDDFTLLHRTEGILDEQAAKDYFASLPFEVYRISSNQTGAAVAQLTQYPSFEHSMATRWTGQGEHAKDVTFDQLQAGLEQLESSLLREQPQEMSVARARFELPNNGSGYEALRLGTRALGANKRCSISACHDIRARRCLQSAWAGYSGLVQTRSLWIAEQ